MAGINLRGLINRIELNDISSIQKVIQYFPLISEVERNQTIMRLTNALIRMQEKVRITNTNPICKYLKPGTYVEDDTLAGPTQVFIIVRGSAGIKMVESLSSYISSIRSIEDGNNEKVDSALNRLFGKEVMDVYNCHKYETILKEVREKCNFNFVWYTINNVMMNYCNKKIISFMDDSGNDTYTLKIINAILLDMNEALIRKRNISVNEIIGRLKVISNNIDYLPMETWGIVYFIENADIDNDARETLFEIKQKIATSFLLEENVIGMILRETTKNPSFIFNNCIYGQCSYVQEILEDYKRKYEVELNEKFDDILSTKRYRYHYDEIKQDASFTWLIENLEYLRNRDLTKFKKSLGKALLKTTIPDTQLYALYNAGIATRFVYFPYQDVTLAINKKTCYILASNMDKVYMFPTFNGNELDKIRRMELMVEPLTVRIIQFNKDRAVDLVPTDLMVIEATNQIEFDKDTNLKFNFRKVDKNTYMNRYSDIHALLVQNSRNKNYQAMKTDLCRLYALIYIIERDVTHSTKAVSPSVKADGSKARMFAKNDLKRYLAEVTAHEKDFDLAKYFNESDVKKEIEKEYSIKINTLGVKKLLKTFI